METLEIKKDYKVYGFYDSLGLDLEESTLLQVIYLIDGKHYIMYRDDDLFSCMIFKLDMISDLYKNDKDKRNYAVSEFMSHFDASLANMEKYKLFEIDINGINKLIPFNESESLVADDFNVSGDCYNGAIVLDDGRIAVGNEEFLEKIVLDNVKDNKRKYELLEDIYYNYCNFEKREDVINNFYHEFYDDTEGFEKEIWDDKRKNNSLVLYALSLLGPLNVECREVPNAIEDKKVLS